MSDDPTSPKPFQVEHNGITHHGTYSVRGALIYVTHQDKSTATDFTRPNEQALPLARTILKELVSGQGQQQKRAVYVDLQINSVKEYWNKIVVPNVRDCLSTPTLPTVLNAVMVTWHLIDWAWHEKYYGRDTRNNQAYIDYKNGLLKACPEIKWLGDLAEAGKHRGLGRNGITSEGILILKLTDGPPAYCVNVNYESNAEARGALFGIDGVLRKAIVFWQDQLKEHNLPSPFDHV